jgi:hypothetical protein
MGTTAKDSNVIPRYLGAIDLFTKEELENANRAADYRSHKRGANVIPWKQYQSKPR